MSGGGGAGVGGGAGWTSPVACCTVLQQYNKDPSSLSYILYESDTYVVKLLKYPYYVVLSMNICRGTSVHLNNKNFQ